jgi:hypothetical protein
MLKALLLPEMKFLHLCSINITFYQLMASEEVIITDFVCAAKFTFQILHTAQTFKLSIDHNAQFS